MIFDRTHSFDKAYKSLPDEIRKSFLSKITLMENHFDHPSLRVKKISETNGIYEGSINMHYRFTFQLIRGGIILRNIGQHDPVISHK
jgi:mRNA-degrading endonuclease RelE of RelBE toxin-antitoxin system